MHEILQVFLVVFFFSLHGSEPRTFPSSPQTFVTRAKMILCKSFWKPPYEFWLIWTDPTQSDAALGVDPPQKTFTTPPFSLSPWPNWKKESCMVGMGCWKLLFVFFSTFMCVCWIFWWMELLIGLKCSLYFMLGYSQF